MTGDTRSTDLEALLASVVLHHEQHGVLPDLNEVARHRPELARELSDLAHEYLALAHSLETGVFGAEAETATVPDAKDPRGSRRDEQAFPVIDGFRTIERIGAGGMGEVYKLYDEKLGRVVAAKIVRNTPGAVASRLHDFIREARSLALFSDARIVQIYECRTDTEPAVIIMEYVDGFELGRIGPSLEMRQRVKVMHDVCLALQHAHALGIQHRDLKPSNIMLDAALRPKILDFGLSDSDPASGHFRGTPQYISPEQLDRSQPIDARTDVYALGVIMYELLCGAAPFTGSTPQVLDAIRTAQPRLPREIDPQLPEPLQAIALKAMERLPADRYASALEMAGDLERWLASRPVLARPTQYATTLAARVTPHLDQIGEWARLKLIYPHEAARLNAAYRALDAREDDWIVASRELSYAQITLYLGAFFVFAGSLFYFVAHRMYEGATGMIGPLLVLGLPFAGLNLAGRRLYQRDHQAVAVAFFLGGLTLLPLFLLIWFHDVGWWRAGETDTHQLFVDGSVSNRQLQITLAVACVWASWLAVRTRTTALSTFATVLFFLFGVVVLGDLGFRAWFEDGRYDLMALHLAPLVAVYGGAGWLLERSGREWFARPAYVAAAVTLLVAMDLFALNGKLLHYAGVTMRAFQPSDVGDPVLLDTLAGFALNGFLFYLVAALVERRGSSTMSLSAFVLFTVAPFSMLEPLAVLSETAVYSRRFDWIYLGLAVAIAILSHQRQRKSFYYAGLLNSGIALILIADRNEWLGRPAWAVSIVVAGLAALGAGFLLDTRRRRRR